MSDLGVAMSPLRCRRDWIWVKAQKNWLTLVYIAVIVSVTLTLVIIEAVRMGGQ